MVDTHFITKSVPQPFEHKELCKSTLSLDSTSSRKDCPRHCQSLAGMEDVDSAMDGNADAPRTMKVGGRCHVGMLEMKRCAVCGLHYC